MVATRVDFGPAGTAEQAVAGSSTTNLAIPEQITRSATDTSSSRMAWDVQRGGLIDNRPQAVNMADVGNGAKGILGTAQTNSGSPRMVVDLKPTDTVDIGGTRTSVTVAERMGLIVRGPTTGLYREPGAARGNADSASNDPAEGSEGDDQDDSSNETQEAPEGDPDADQTMTATGAEEAISELARSTSPGTQVRAMGQLIMTGEVDRHTLSALASEAGLHPDEVSAKISTITQGFQAQADDVAASVGVHDPDDFYSWAKAAKPAELRKAMQDQAMSRNTGGFRSLASAYVENLDSRDPQAILSASFGNGITAKKASDGRVVLSVPGRGEVSWRAAVASGLVKVSRAR